MNSDDWIELTVYRFRKTLFGHTLEQLHENCVTHESKYIPCGDVYFDIGELNLTTKVIKNDGSV